MFEYLDGLDDLIYKALADAYRAEHPGAALMEVFVAVSDQQRHLTVQDALAILTDKTITAAFGKQAA